MADTKPSISSTPDSNAEMKELMSTTCKFECQDSLTTRFAGLNTTLQDTTAAIGRLEDGQCQLVLHNNTLDFPQQHKDRPMGSTRFLNRCEHHFCGQRTIEEERVWLAALQLHGLAQQWYGCPT